MAGSPLDPDHSAWKQAIRHLGDRVTPAQIERLVRYRDLMLKWNARFNLTGLRTAGEIDYRLILDSVRFWAFVDEQLGTGSIPRALVDVGSGSGIPGIPISIIAPGVHVTMIEATGKKAQFIQTAIDTLHLENARVVHGRSEEVAREPEFRESFDIAVARAVGPIATLLELVMPLLRTGGRAFLPRGDMEKAEIWSVPAVANLLGGTLSGIVPLEQLEGCPGTQVVIADKLGPIPERYPRRAGIPAREPLKG